MNNIADVLSRKPSSNTSKVNEAEHSSMFQTLYRR